SADRGDCRPSAQHGGANGFARARSGARSKSAAVESFARGCRADHGDDARERRSDRAQSAQRCVVRGVGGGERQSGGRSDRGELAEHGCICGSGGVARAAIDGKRLAPELRPRRAHQGADARGGGGARTRVVSRGESGRAAEGERKSEMRLRSLIPVVALLLLANGCSFFSRSQSKFFTLERVAPAAVTPVRGTPVAIDGIELPPGMDRREVL